MAKDWSGNKASTFKTLGASNHTLTDREVNDYYATDPRVIDELFSVETFEGGVWEPSCGEGHLSKEIEKHTTCISSDLIARGYGGVMDFLTADKLYAPNIITNPPYKYAQEFVEKSIDLGADKIAMFLKLTFLEGSKRGVFFKSYPPARIWVYSSRRKCAINGDFDSTGSSAAAYAWFIWEKGNTNAPVIGWIK